MSEFVLTTHEMPSVHVASPMTYDLLQPAALPPGAPVLLWLHGGDGPDGFGARIAPVFGRAWADGTLPSVTVVAPRSGRSFWMDGLGAGTAWGTMLADEVLPFVRATHDTGDVALVAGVSMGGMGALRLAFRHPDRFVAVAAIEPAIEPTADWSAVHGRDRFYRADAITELFGDPVDARRFRHNHPLAVAGDEAVRIAASGLAVFLECGDEDALNLHHGAEALHRRLWDLGIRHEYRSVRGGNHVGRGVGERIHHALGFVGRALADHDPDPEVVGLVGALDTLHLMGGFRREVTVAGPAGPIQAWEYDAGGPPVVLVPSLGRGASDFDDLARRLAIAGFHTIQPEPRGINGSTGGLDGLTMADLAADVAAVIHARASGPATVVGHAFGNRVARMTATEFPHLVDSVVLLCCGGLVRPAPEHEDALMRLFDQSLPDDERLALIDSAFFAPGNDAAVWADGWYPEVAAAQGAATAGQPVGHWWGAGGKDLFVVQPADDVMAVPENAHRICAEFPDRASMVVIDDAGHALLPEQPDAVEVAVRRWLTRTR